MINDKNQQQFIYCEFATFSTEDGMTTEGVEKYFHLRIRKRVVWWLLVVALIGYGGAILRNEFIWSKPGSAMELARLNNKEAFEKLDCHSKSNLRIERFAVPNTRVPKRNSWFLERAFIYGRYMDAVVEFPECLANAVIGTQGDPRDYVMYYYERTSDKPIVKVTVESVTN